MMIKGIVFDMDGVLLDAAEWHYSALNKALGLFGYEIGAEEHAAIFNGLPTRVKLELLTQRREFPRALHEFVSEMKQVYTREVFENLCHPDASLSALLKDLKLQGYKLAVASNSIRPTVDLVMNKMQIAPYFDVVLSNYEVKRPKPNPEIYLKAIRALKLQAKECVIVEDSMTGREAAMRACPHVFVVASSKEVSGGTFSAYLSRLSQNSAPKKPKLKVAGSAKKKSNPTLEVVIPMAGLGTRFSEAGYANPKPLIEVMGKPMIQWVVENLQSKRYQAKFTFLCNEQHLRQFRVASFLQELVPGCNIISVPKTTAGAACTVMLAKSVVPSTHPLLIANSDQWVDYNIDDFLPTKRSNVDGLIMTFRDSHPKWSFAKVDENGFVTAVAEKQPISDNATVGIYYYRMARQFFEGVESMIQANIRTNNEFYVCPVYNQMINKKLKIRIHAIPRDKMHGLGTPEDLKNFLKLKQQAA